MDLVTWVLEVGQHGQMDIPEVFKTSTKCTDLYTSSVHALIHVLLAGGNELMQPTQSCDMSMYVNFILGKH